MHVSSTKIDSDSGSELEMFTCMKHEFFLHQTSIESWNSQFHFGIHAAVDVDVDADADKWQIMFCDCMPDRAVATKIVTLIVYKNSV